MVSLEMEEKYGNTNDFDSRHIFSDKRPNNKPFSLR